MAWFSTRVPTARALRRWQPALEKLEDRVQASATPTAPVYHVAFDDAVTADNAFTAADGQRAWDVDPGADDYQTDVYERPTTQSYRVRLTPEGEQRFAAEKYHANLDIVRARAGFDDRFLYVSIELAGLDVRTADRTSTPEGLVYRYGLRLARQADGGGGFLVVADQPALKNSPATAFGQQGTFIYRDGDGDVGGTGLDVTKQDRPAEVGGNGYEQVFASDGRTEGGTRVVWVRTSPADARVVEFAINYSALGLTAEDLRQLPSLEFEANKGLQDPANYLWNDEYTGSEAGSPYRATAGDRSKSIFGTQGLGNVYELDTLRGGPLGNLGPAALSGFVYMDLNANGVRDEGEPGIEGVSLMLTRTDLAGDSEPVFVTTNSDGFYRFEGLAPGTYRITELQLASLEDGAESVGLVGGVERGTVLENDVIGEIVLGPGENGVFYNFGELGVLPPNS
ncbi:MAG: hypothetical protein L0Z62_21415 [Gemmataceae bacterium]|nr:hypothetical protein [Gemmataceae bacterium]